MGNSNAKFSNPPAYDGAMDAKTLLKLVDPVKLEAERIAQEERKVRERMDEHQRFVSESVSKTIDELREKITEKKDPNETVVFIDQNGSALESISQELRRLGYLVRRFGFTSIDVGLKREDIPSLKDNAL